MLIISNPSCTLHLSEFEITHAITPFIKSILKSLVKSFFSANENGTVKQNNQSDFKGARSRYLRYNFV